VNRRSGGGRLPGEKTDKRKIIPFMKETAIILTAGILHTGDAKTAHGLIRESGRFQIIGVVDPVHAGSDAGEVLDGKHRQIPVVKDVEAGLALEPTYCIVGVATI